MEFGIIMYILFYLKWINNKGLLYKHMLCLYVMNMCYMLLNFAQCYVAARIGREFGREWI